jgi:xanthine dehydrogenase accessory factor
MLVLRWAVTTAARYIALIGSKRKVISVVAELEKEGVPRERLERIYGPMGLAIGALTPEEIAISVGAEMVAVHRQPKSNWQALSMSFFRHDESKAPLP